MSVVTRATVRGKGRVYTNALTGEQYPSVTTILGVLARPALPRWASRSVAEYVVENGLTSIETMTPDDAVRYLAGVPWAARDKAANIGTEVHAAAEAHLLHQDRTFQMPFSPDARHAMDNVRGVLDALQPEVLHLEGTVWNRTHGYAGAFDGIMRIDGTLCMVDWKTSKGVYNETATQLAAYRYGELLIDNETGETTALPEVERCLVFHVPKEGEWSVYEADAGLSEYEGFLAARRIYARQLERGNGLTKLRSGKVSS